MIARFLKNSCLNGIPFGVALGVIYTIIEGVKIGSLLGLIAGLLFGIALAFFMEHQRKKMAIHGKELDGEAVIHQGPANHFLNAEARGGFLYLTESRLVFRAHKMNLQSAETSIALAEISDLQPTRTLGIVPNGILITHGDDQKDRFVVTGRKEWSACLKEAAQLA